VPDGYDWVAEGVYTPEEWVIISESAIDLHEDCRPFSSNEILEVLTKTPINLYATRNDGGPYFHCPNELFGIIQKYEVPALTEDQVVAQLGGLTGAVDGDAGTRGPIPNPVAMVKMPQKPQAPALPKVPLPKASEVVVTGTEVVDEPEY